MKVVRRRKLLTPSMKIGKTAQMIADFDRLHPVGSTCWYWHALPMGPVSETRIRVPAYRSDSGHVLCMVDGIRGGVSIFYITPVKEDQRAHVTFAEKT